MLGVGRGKWNSRTETPRHRSQEREVELAVKGMTKVIELGGTPTTGDCAMVLRAAITSSYAFSLLQTTHRLGYVFGSSLYDEVIGLCLDLGQLDASVAIVADWETTGIKVANETLHRVIYARLAHENPLNDAPRIGFT